MKLPAGQGPGTVQLVTLRTAVLVSPLPESGHDATDVKRPLTVWVSIVAVQRSGQHRARRKRDYFLSADTGPRGDQGLGRRSAGPAPVWATALALDRNTLLGELAMKNVLLKCYPSDYQD